MLRQLSCLVSSVVGWEAEENSTFGRTCCSTVAILCKSLMSSAYRSFAGRSASSCFEQPAAMRSEAAKDKYYKNQHLRFDGRFASRSADAF